MNIKNFNEFKKFLMKKESNLYYLNKEFYDDSYKDIKISELCRNDYKNREEIEKLQKYLGDDVILFIYDNPGRDNGNLYIHNNNINYDLILNEVKDHPEEYQLIIFRQEHDGYSKEIQAIQDQIKASVYIDVTFPFKF